MIGLLVTCYPDMLLGAFQPPNTAPTHILAFHILILIGLALSGYLNDSQMTLVVLVWHSGSAGLNHMNKAFATGRCHLDVQR